jgi:xanthine dehydrogenase YagR molybdenum-binding subunit
MFTSNGHREEQEQRMTIGARRDGRLTAIRHEKLSITSPFDDWAEPATGVSSQLYACENFQGFHRLIHGNTMTPTFTRGPGESTGSFVLETAMDDLAHELGIDPVELRVQDHAATDPRGNPWTSDGLEHCLRRGAERFAWQDRNHEPGSTRDGNWLIGHGMAAAGYPVAPFMPAQHARARLYADGSAVVEAGTQEFGTGVGTMMTQVGADALGVPLEAVSAGIGDSEMPNISSAVGSAGATMVSASVHLACTALRKQLVATAVADAQSPLHGTDPAAIEVEDGRMYLRDAPDTGESYGELLARNRMSYAEDSGTWAPPPLEAPLGLLTFGAQFAEVAADPEIGLVRVRRMVGAFAPGRVLNPKLASSQLMGGMLWGLGQALLEGNEMDTRHGRWAASNLGEYLVPVNADAPEVVVELVEVEDKGFDPLGVKGVGEIGQVGVAAAIGNALFNATGRRIRRLPLAAELVMDPAPALA